MTTHTPHQLFTAAPILLLILAAFAGCQTTSLYQQATVAPGHLEEAMVRFSATRVGQDGTVISGTGFFLDTPTTVVTSAHVVEGYRVGAIITGEIKGEAAEYRIRAVDPDRDLALLQPVHRTNPSFLTGGDAVRTGEPIVIAGFPAHIPGFSGLYLTSGILSSSSLIKVRNGEYTYRLLPTDAFATVGNSGGPVLNAHGEVVGMVQAVVSRSSPYEGATLFIPIDQVNGFVAEHGAAESFPYLE